MTTRWNDLYGSIDRTFIDDLGKGGITRPVTQDALPRGPVLPRTLSLSSALVPFEQAVVEWAALTASFAAKKFHGNLVGNESKIDALSLAGLDATPGSLLRLLLAEAVDDHPYPRELRKTFQALETCRHGLDHVRAGGRASLTLDLLSELGVRLGGHAAAILSGDLHDGLADPPSMPLLLRVALLVARIEIALPFGPASHQVALLLLPLAAIAEARQALFLGHAVATRKPDYDRALARLRADGAVEDWVTFYFDLVASAARETSVRLDVTEGVRLSLADELEALRSHSTGHRLADLAIAMPVMTVGTAQRELGVSFQTANAAIATLVRLGMLLPHSNVRRNRIFIVSRMLSIMAPDCDPCI
jgi:hypothetical protein